MNPHRVKITQQPAHIGGLFHGHCAADDCGAQWGPLLLTELYPKAVQHQIDHADDRTVYRRTDWTEPMEDI